MSTELLRLAQAAFDLFFPRYCICCGQRLQPHERYLCVSCLLVMPRVPLAGFNPTAQAMEGWPVPVRAASLYYYTHGSPYGHIVHRAKYQDQPEVAAHFARLLALELLPLGFFSGMQVVMPVPLAPRRLRQRGYNQSLYIARAVAQVAQLPVRDDVIRRTAHHTTQTQLGRVERMRNMAQLFVVDDAERVKGLHVLLVDDVITTGATIGSCAEALMQAGASEVSVLSLALASGT